MHMALYMLHHNKCNSHDIINAFTFYHHMTAMDWYVFIDIRYGLLLKKQNHSYSDSDPSRMLLLHCCISW